jgi:WD40 repeat protein
VSANPFPGPQPYRASDRDRFFGREELSARLEDNVLAHRCVTVYGPSGAGKSSMLQAAVIPRLLEAQQIDVVRVDTWPEESAAAGWLASAMYGQLGLGAPPEGLSPGDAIAAAAKRAARRSARLLVVYLDQIEQLLYASRSAVETDALFDCVHGLLALLLRNVRVVLVLREDYLGRFRDRLREREPLLARGFRVGPLTVAELCRAVCRAAGEAEPPQRWDPAETRDLLIQVRIPGQEATEGAEAQAAYAQIVCRALFQQRAGGVEADGAVAETILRRYLDATVADLGPLRGAAGRLLEDHLVTADGTRTLRTEKELLRVLPEADLSPVLRALEGAAILHAEEHQGSRYFELGHDWLARRVHEQRREREREAALLEERAEAEARLAAERARRRTLVLITLAALTVAAVTGALGFWAWAQKREAERARVDANHQREAAVSKQLEARDARILAGFRELSARGQLAWGMKLLPEVARPSAQRGWIELASDALNACTLRASLRGHDASLGGASWSPDGKRALTASADGTARVWSADGRGVPVVLRGHEGPLTAATWSPDGARVLTASRDGTARVWSADGRGVPVVLRGHEGPLTAAAWSPDGAHLVTASEDGTARVWSADGGGGPVVLRGHEGPLTAAIFAPGGARVLTASRDGTARVWSAVGEGKSMILAGHQGEVTAVAASPDGTRVVTASLDKTARVWDAEGKQKPVVLQGHEGAVYHVAVSPDGQLVATASADRTARVFSIDGRGEPVVLRGHGLSVVHVAFRPDGRYVATASADRTARLWPADGSGAALVLAGHEAPVRSATWSPDGSQVLTAAADPSERSPDHTAKVWSAEPLRSLPRAHRGGRVFHGASIDAGSERVAAAYDDGAARLFGVAGGADPVVFRGHDGWVASVTLSPRGDRVVTASFDGTARVWSVDGKGAPVVLIGHQAELRYAALSPDGARVVTVSEDRTARVWSADGKGAPVVLAGHEDWLTSAAWSPDGARVVTTSLDHTARVWSADGKGAPVVLSGHRGDVLAAAWSPDGARVVTASEDWMARVFRADGAGAPLVLRGHEGAVLQAIWSPDGARLATSSADRTVRLWSAASGAQLIVLEAPAPVIALSFLAGGQTIFTVAADNTTHAWMIDVEALKARLHTAHADCLPPEVREAYLGEPEGAARGAYAACERSYQRAPEGTAP